MVASGRYIVTKESGIDFYNMGKQRVGTLYKDAIFTIDTSGNIIGVSSDKSTYSGSPATNSINASSGKLPDNSPSVLGFKQYVLESVDMEGYVNVDTAASDTMSDFQAVGVEAVSVATNAVAPKKPTESKSTEEYDDGDDVMLKIFSTTTAELSTEDYEKNLEKGLRVSDLRGILGMPHQFLPNTDPRIDGTNNLDSFGRKYSERIIAEIPLLMMTPGSPIFMSSYKQSEKRTVIGKLMKAITSTDDALNDLFNDSSGKYYSLKYDYLGYFEYVNSMLRSAAFFLGIEDVEIDDNSGSKQRLGTLDWYYHAQGDIFSHGGLRRYLGTYGGSIPFYVDSETSISESFGNSTTTSSIVDTINGLSSQAKELNFILGNVSGMSGFQLDKFTSQENLEKNIESVSGTIDNLLGKGNILSTLAGSARTILSGGKMLFPRIWDDSNFSRSYDCKMKLVSPSGDKLSIYLNILVPIYHLLGFTLPRQSIGQAYYSPFLVRAFYKGLFNVDIGLITSLNVTKGDEGYWTQDGLPTVANVSFSIEDMYDGLFMSSQHDSGDLNIMKNISELDYIATSCGINIDEPEITRTIKMYRMLYLGLSVDNILHDKIGVGIFGKATQWFNNKIQGIFGTFK